jgi:quercetin dioxygenase-like cupin family protein
MGGTVSIQPSFDVATSLATGLAYNLARELGALRGVDTFSMQGHRAKTLIRNDDFTIVLMALREGAHIRNHRAEHPTTLSVLRGNLRVGLTAVTLEIEAQQLLSLEPCTIYDLEAIEDTDLLLIVGR